MRITISLIVAGGYSETLGIPALFDSRYFHALASLRDTAGAKSLIEVHAAGVVSYPFPKARSTSTHALITSRSAVDCRDAGRVGIAFCRVADLPFPFQEIDPPKATL